MLHGTIENKEKRLKKKVLWTQQNLNSPKAKFGHWFAQLVQFNRSVVCSSLRPHESQHAAILLKILNSQRACKFDKLSYRRHISGSS